MLRRSRFRCYGCGKRLGPGEDPCPRCDAAQTTRCECGESVSVHAGRCEACDERFQPRRYHPPLFLLRLVLLPLFLLGVVVAVVWLLSAGTRTPEGEILEAARSDLRQERFDRAELRLRRYLEEHGEHPIALELLGRALFGLDRRVEGRARLERALELDPHLDSASVYLAWRRHEAGDVAGALRLARLALAEPPEPREAHFLVGKILTRQDYRDLGQARRHLEAATRDGLDAPEAHVLLAEIALAHFRAQPSETLDRRFTERIRTARKLVSEMLETTESDETRSKRLFFLARCDLAMGRLGAARGTLTRAAKFFPPTPEQRLLLAEVLWRSGEKPRARDILRKLAEEEVSALVLLMAEDFCHRRGERALAGTLFGAAVKRYAGDPGVVLTRARRLVHAGDREGAQAALEKARDSRPDDDRLLLALVDLLSTTPEGLREAEALLAPVAKRRGPGSLPALRRIEVLLDSIETKVVRDDLLKQSERMLLSARAARESAETAENYLSLLTGRIHLARGRTLEAVTAFKKAIEGDPGDPRPHLLLATAHRRQGDHDREASALSAAIRIAGPAPSLLLVRGRAYLDAGLDSLARRDCESALEIDPDRVPALRLLGHALIRGEDADPKRAIEVLRRAVAGGGGIRARVELAAAMGRAGDPDSARAELEQAHEEAEGRVMRSLVADALLRLPGAAEKAGEILRELLDDHPDDIPSLLRLAAVRFEAGDRDAARELLAEILRRDPANLTALRVCFEMALEGPVPEKADVAEARRLAREVSRIASPEDAVACYLEGRLALLDGDYSRALPALRAAVQGAFTDHAAERYLAEALLRQGHLSEARSRLLAILRVSPDDTPARRLLALVITEEARRSLIANDTDRAKALLEQAVSESLDLALAQLYLAGTRLVEGLGGDDDAIEKAREDCERLVEKLSGSEAPAARQTLAEALLLLGDICYASRDTDGLLRACDAYRRLRPDDPVGGVRMCVALLAAGDPDGAVREMEATRRSMPESRGLLAAMVSVLEEAGRPEEAVRTVEQWIATRPKDDAAKILLGRTLHRAGRAGEAETVFREILAREPDRLAAIDGVFLVLSAGERWDDLQAFLEKMRPRTRWKPEVTSLIGRCRLGRNPSSGIGAAQVAAALEEGVTSPLHRADCTLHLMRFRAGEEAFPTVVDLWRDFSNWLEKHPDLLLRPPFTHLIAEIHLLGAEAYEAQGMRKRAVELLRRAIRARPDFVPALNNLACHLLEDPLGRRESVGLARRAAKLAPETPEVWDTLALALLGAKREEEALDAARKAVEGAAEPVGEVERARLAAIHVTSARILLALARRDEAIDALRAAAETHAEIVRDAEYLRALRLAR